jgi:competence protein ComGC
VENQLNFGGYSQQRSKGMAIASLVVGIISLFTCSLFLIGAVVGLILGIIALNKASKQPENYEGRGLAIAGIVASAFSLVVCVLMILIAIPNLIKSRQAAYEAAAIGAVRQIATGQATYAATKGEGKFTDLRTLAVEGMIDFALGSGQKNGYVFTSEPVKGGAMPMFDVTAKPMSTGTFGTGNRSFYTNETYVIYMSRSSSPPAATPQNRAPRNATALE